MKPEVLSTKMTSAVVLIDEYSILVLLNLGFNIFDVVLCA